MKESPRKYQRHVFVCIKERPADRQSCGSDGGSDILIELRKHINEHGLMHSYNVSKVDCLGHCLEGPAITIYPEGKTFTNVTAEDLKMIKEEFLS